MTKNNGTTAKTMYNRSNGVKMQLVESTHGDFFVSNFVDSDRAKIEEALRLSGNTDKAVIAEALDMFGSPMDGWFGLYGVNGFCTPSFYLSLNTNQDAGEVLDTLELLGA